MILSVELLKKFNPSGNVSALEFLVGMLTYGDIVDKERDIDPILRKFIELDIHKKGVLSIEDLKKLRNSIHVDDTSRDSSFKIVYEDVLDVVFNRHHTSRDADDDGTLSSPMHSMPSSIGSRPNQKVIEGNIENVVESL